MSLTMTYEMRFRVRVIQYNAKMTKSIILVPDCRNSVSPSLHKDLISAHVIPVMEGNINKGIKNIVIQ